MKKSTLVLLCGLPGAGKTTLAKKLSQELSAIVSSPDQEMYERGISFFDEKARADIEAVQWQKALELAKDGKNVVLENGFWGRDERDRLRLEAHSLDLRIELRYLDIPFEELWQRVDARNKKGSDKDAVMTRQHFEQSASQFQPPNIEELILFDNPSCLPIKLIAIDGHGGSGKSTLAEMLAKRFNAEIIHTDDFAGWDNPENWWPLVIERVFEPIKNGATTISYTRSKWWETHTPAPVVNQPVTNVMILEGVTALRKEFRPYIPFGIFVDTPLEICLQRGFERDRGQDGKTDDEIRSMWRQWYEKEAVYIARDDPKAFADLVLDGTMSFEIQLN